MAAGECNATIEKLRLEQIRLREGLVARNTVVGYSYDVRMYAAWCANFHRASLPTTTETLALYLTDLLSQGKKITTARRRKCAIVHEHRARGFPCPDTREIQELLRGAQRLRGEKPRQMRPVSVPELRRMSAGLAKIGTAAAMRNRALLVVGFASALRRSNLAALTIADVEFSPQGLVLRIDREKQDQEGRGRLIGILRGRHTHTDPVRVLKGWLRLRGDHPGPLFSRLSVHRRCALGWRVYLPGREEMRRFYRHEQFQLWGAQPEERLRQRGRRGQRRRTAHRRVHRPESRDRQKIFPQNRDLAEQRLGQTGAVTPLLKISDANWSA